MTESNGSGEQSIDSVDDNGFNEAVLLQRWVHSPAPNEESPDADENSVDIIGEEIMPDGSSLYEVLWRGWAGRYDGTRTAWYNAIQIHKNFNPELRERWDESQKDRRNKIARESFEVTVQTSTDIHNTHTHLRSQAYDEKVDYYQDNAPTNWMDELERVRGKHEARRRPEFTASDCSAKNGQDSLSSSAPPSARLESQNALKITPSSRFIFGGSAASAPTTLDPMLRSANSVDFILPPPASNLPKSLHSSHPSTWVTMDTPTSSPISKGKEEEACSFRLTSYRQKRPRFEVEEDNSGPPLSAIESWKEDSSPARQTSPHAASSILRCTALAEEWSKIAATSGASSLTFTSNIPGNNEILPDIPDNFRYIESQYEFDDAVLEDVNNLRSFVSSCDLNCTSCNDPKTCSCYANWDDKNSGQNLYTLEYLGEIQECNTNCKCVAVHCRNRVAQIPRDFTIDIFKTPGNRGWGVRSPSAIKRDKVLGLYTGLVMSREKANTLENASYIYDLDDNDDVQTKGEYSVDSRCCGNWTRFIKHSHEPNLRVHTFVHDRPIRTGLYYIVFVANKDIPAWTELTVHYNPGAAISHKRKAKKAASRQ